MKHTPDLVRKENGIVWREVWRIVGILPFKTPHSFRRPLIRDLSKADLMACAARRAPSHWLIDIALLEAMRRVKGSLQTDIEDFVPTTQPHEHQSPP